MKTTKSNLEAATKNLLQYFPSGVKVNVNQTGGAVTFTVQATKEQIINEKFGDLIGQPITLTEAAKKYGVKRATIEGWYYRASYITPLDEDAYPKTFDEAEVAYLVEIYNDRRKTGSLAPLLDENGLPYQIKDPERAAKVRKQRARLRDT